MDKRWLKEKINWLGWWHDVLCSHSLSWVRDKFPDYEFWDRVGITGDGYVNLVRHNRNIKSDRQGFIVYRRYPLTNIWAD